MPRQRRIEYEGAIYHILSRGDRRELIFRDDLDREAFLRTLKEACAKTDWQVHAYCLMPNHFHLVVETPNANLVAGMKWFLGTYTSRFNRRHKLTGHLFSGRYKSLIVDGSGSGYFRSVCDYVHLNPVRANLLKAEQPLHDFAWSSYPAYLQSPATKLSWLRVDRLLGEMGIRGSSSADRIEFERVHELRRAAEAGADWREVRRNWCLGADAFRKQVLARVEGKPDGLQYAAPQREATVQRAEQKVAEELARLGWTDATLAEGAKGDPEKVRIAQLLRRETAVGLKWIAVRLKMGSWSYAASLVYGTKPAPVGSKVRRRREARSTEAMQQAAGVDQVEEPPIMGTDPSDVHLL